MYYSAALESSSSYHCIGAAIASSIDGPYTPVGESPLICPLSEGGAIDSSGFNDDGTRYIVYKIDGNSIGHGGDCGNDVAPYVETPLMLQQVSGDGLTLQGQPYKLLDHNGASDQGIVEAPSLLKSGQYYYLFFSPGCFTTRRYSISYAYSKSINGPYTRVPTPLFATDVYGLTAPGGADVFDDGHHLLFHANYGDGRALYAATITMS
ncbi:MAG: glycoside hydrolase family 43 protein [Acidomyces sp. 'richmondensis']|nr:MAG: glycoside hydrolase family 43 protein [Acidomyces sp. 'richmondensis']